MSEAKGEQVPGRRERLSDHLALLIGTAMALIVVELVARCFFPAPLQWYLPQNVFEASPSLGFRYRPNQVAYTADKPFRTNSIGLRGPERQWEKSTGVYRILVLGDSIAMGFGVREEDTFSALLERNLNRVPGQSFEVINAAVAAYSTNQEVEYYAQEGRYLDPDLVIIGLYWNDVSDKSAVGVSPDGNLIEGLAAAPPSTVSQVAASPLAFWVRNALKRSRALYVATFKLRQLLTDSETDSTRMKQQAVLLGTDAPDISAGWHSIEGELQRLRDMCRQEDVPLLIVVIPMPQQLTAQFPRIRYQSIVRDICARQALWCLDPLPAFEAEYDGHDSLYIPYDGDHPNERGHLLLARELTGELAAMFAKPARNLPSG